MPQLSKYVPIGVPPRTRVYHVVRHPDDHSWRMWIAVADMQQPYRMWLGTYLELFDDGRVTRVTIRDDHDDIMEIKDHD